MVNSASVIATEMEKVTKKVPVLYDMDDLFYTEIEKRPVEVISERDMRIPMNLRPGGYFGYYDPDGGDLGIGSGPDWQKGVINTNHFKIGIQWTKKAEWGTDSSSKAVINTFRELMAKAMPEFRKQSDNQCHTAGNGILGVVSTQGPGPGGTTELKLNTDGYEIRLLRFGQRINFYNAAQTVQKTVNPSKIVYYDVNSAIIRVSPAVAGLVAGDVITPEGLSGPTPTGLFGIPYHISNSSVGLWLGYDRATTPEIRANGVDAGGAALALPFPRLAINLIGDRVGINERTKLQARMHPCQVQAYEDLGQLVSIIQKQASDEALNLYFSDNIRMAGAPVKQDYSHDKKRIDIMKMETWGRAELHPAGFYEVDGRRMFEMRGPSGGVATSQIFYIVASWNLYTDNPAAQSYIYNLAVPTGYIPA
jgi:hypothetical protein